MKRFVIEHLPRAAATYSVTPMSFSGAKAWLAEPQLTSLVRTTEMIEALSAAAQIDLQQSDESMALRPGDEALLITLSFGVLLAWAQGGIAPLPEDWRCLLLTVDAPTQPSFAPVLEAAVSVDLPAGEPH